MTYKIKDIRKVFPIYSVRDGILLSKRGDITFGWKITYPAAFSVSEQEYDDLLNSIASAVRMLPEWCIVHKQDCYFEKNYEPSAPDSFLGECNSRHFAGRKYLEHESYLFLTFSNGNEVRRSAAGSSVFGSRTSGTSNYDKVSGYVAIAEQFMSLFSEHRKGFENIAYSYVHDREVAKDMVTDVFVHLWSHREEIDWDVNLKGYVYMGIRSRCISWLRRQQSARKAHDYMARDRKWREESAIAALADDSVSSRLFSSEVISIFRKELDRMPGLTREVFLASRIGDRTYQEIAMKLGIKERRVATEMQKALDILRKGLRDYI